VTIMNPESLSSTETGVDPEIRSWKNHLSKWARRKKAIGVVYFTKKWKVETLQRGLGIGSFKPRLKGCNFNTHLLAERSVFYFYLFIFFFFLDHYGLLKIWSKDLSNGTNVVSWLANFLFCLHIYSLYVWRRSCDIEMLKTEEPLNRIVGNKVAIFHYFWVKVNLKEKRKSLCELTKNSNHHIYYIIHYVPQQLYLRTYLVLEWKMDS
jgi:hypothetical protein